MKQARAFSLPEVMMALFVLSTTMFVLGQLQMRSMMRVYTAREEADRLYLVKKYLYRMYLSDKPARKMSQKFDEPYMSLTVEPSAIHKKSSLSAYASDLQMLRARASWQSGVQDRSLTMVTFALQPPRKEES
jgi:Tfp pilus assembly protein PilV